MNKIEGASQYLKHLATASLLVSSMLGLSGCSPGEINCFTGQKSVVQDYPNVVVGQTINVQGVHFIIENGVILLGSSKKSQWRLTVQKLVGNINITATLQSAINKLPSADQDLKVEQQCLP